MQLGDWVEFDTIVIKEATLNGSHPATQSIGRARIGQVVGERYVYDVQAGAPPTLSNRQAVLLVAVSLHRTYRVFPADARTTAAPTPRRRRAPSLVPQPATGATINLASGGITMSGRTIFSQADLDVLVADHINQQIAVGAIFTAYDVTLGLRDSNPGVDIPHEAVRRTVHAQMDAIVSSKLYDRETASFGADSALRYVPV
jgi:hypothetical protein